MSGHTTRTSETMVTQIDLGHAVAELADVGRELEAGVFPQVDGAPVAKLPAQELDRYRPCARAKFVIGLCGAVCWVVPNAPVSEHSPKSSSVMSSPSSPMLLGSVKPLFLERDTLQPLAFMLMRASGSSPVHHWLSIRF